MKYPPTGLSLRSARLPTAMSSGCGWGSRPGVPADELESMFEPFHRGSNTGGASGFGLGLAIARRAIDAHGGAIHALNREGGGLLVEITLPLAADAPQKE
ncbi:ATP-binding protein [Zoogloea sp.]|uniref:sensor histidine kinase n=1 Tax=Zoogloea sp. TaxID=49181 RepID=UPI0025FCA008|nr:ATP-binding protein [Zoogloea sp.]